MSAVNNKLKSKTVNITEILYMEINILHELMREIDYEFLQYLPFCRRNLLYLANYFLKHLFQNIVSGMIQDKYYDIWDRDKFREKYINISGQYKFTNIKFLVFFLSFFTPLYLCIRKKLISLQKSKEQNETDKYSKIIRARKLIVDLYNLIALQLDGLDISCEILKYDKLCDNYSDLCDGICKAHGFSSCSDKTKNIIVLFVNPIYYETLELFDDILNSLSLIENPNNVLMFVDYTYAVKPGENKIYSWKEQNAWSRYQKVKEKVFDIYFINHQDHVTFDEYEDLLKSKILSSKEEYDNILKLWLDNKLTKDGINQ